MPAPEVCNGADDNCNGTVDEGMGGKECTVKNQFGQCPGTELCLGGVTMCDAADPATEICDGMDNNCDGMTDEGSLDTDQDGKANCLDNDDDNDLVVDELDNCPLAYNADQKDADFDQLGNACDLDDDNDGVADETDCQPLDKNSFPAAAEVCDGKDNDCDLWVDEGTCSDGNPCTDDVCDPSAGCKNPPNEASCEDGNPCTGGDQCAEGKCKPGVNVCFCQKDADCAALGFVGGCMGKLYCDLNAAPTVCKLDPSQATPCPPAQGACQASACNPATGDCVTTAAADGTVCDDGNACTAGDKCASGKCVSGQNLCQCQVDADCAPFEDGDKCNGTLYCDKTQMFPACKLKADSVVKCGPAAGACKMNVCDPGTGKCGLANAADMNGCDDQDKCSIGDHCSKGQCVAQAFLECDDDNQCTKDACDPDVGCYYASLNNVPCSDGDLCTAGDTCKQGLCVPCCKVGCDDGN